MVIYWTRFLFSLPQSADGSDSVGHRGDELLRHKLWPRDCLCSNAYSRKNGGAPTHQELLSLLKLKLDRDVWPECAVVRLIISVQHSDVILSRKKTQGPGLSTTKQITQSNSVSFIKPNQAIFGTSKMNSTSPISPEIISTERHVFYASSC